MAISVKNMEINTCVAQKKEDETNDKNSFDRVEAEEIKNEIIEELKYFVLEIMERQNSR